MSEVRLVRRERVEAGLMRVRLGIYRAAYELAGVIASDRPPTLRPTTGYGSNLHPRQ